VPIRIEIGPKDIEKKHAKVVTRHNGNKEFIKLDQLEKHVQELANNYTDELKKKTIVAFDSMIEKVNTMDEIKKAIDHNKIACCGFCSIDLDGEACAETVEKDFGAFVRGKKVADEKNKFEKCAICGKPAKETVYIAKSY